MASEAFAVRRCAAWASALMPAPAGSLADLPAGRAVLAGAPQRPAQASARSSAVDGIELAHLHRDAPCGLPGLAAAAPNSSGAQARRDAAGQRVAQLLEGGRPAVLLQHLGFLVLVGLGGDHSSAGALEPPAAPAAASSMNNGDCAAR